MGTFANSVDRDQVEQNSWHELDQNILHPDDDILRCHDIVQNLFSFFMKMANWLQLSVYCVILIK